MARTRQTARRSTGGRAPRRSFRGGRGRGRGRGGFRRGRGRGRGRGGGRGGRRSRAGKAKAVQAVGGERIHGSQLVLLTLQQSLDPEFVFQQTRDEATGDGEQQQHEDVSSGVAAASTSSSAVARRGLSTANSRGVLISQVMRESRTQHLTAGLSQFVRGQEAPIVLARLGRELAALGMSADVSFQTLSAKRSVLLARMYEAYEEQWREKKMSGSRRSARGSGRSLHKMAEIGITSGVHTMLMLVQHSAQTDMGLCLNLLDFLADKLRAVPAMAFAADSSLPAPAVSAEIFEAVHETLVRVAGNAATPEPVRARTLQLLLLAATLRGSLSYFLSVVKLLLARSSDAGQGGLLSVLDTLHKLHRSTPKATIGAPVAAEHEATITASEVGSNPALVVQGRARVEPVLATDGCYLYEYSSRGLFKIGTGLEGSMPGVVYARIPCFRAGDQNVSLVACGGYLFYRSDNIGQNLMLVLDCRYLTEIGGVKSDGSGTFASADLSHLADFVSPDHETAFDAQQVEQVEDEGVSPEAHLAELQAQLAAMDDELFQYENMGNYQLAENLRMERMLLEEEVQTLEYELTGSISQRNSVPHAAHSFNFAPDPFGHQQGLGGWGATSAAHASTSAIPAVPTPAAAPSTPATKSTANDRIGQLLSDGRFLFAMVPFKPDGVDASTSADAGNAGPAAELTTALQQAVSSGVMTEQEARTMMDGQSLDDVAGGQASASDAALRRGYRVHAFDPESQLEHCHSVQLSCPNAGKRSQVVLDMSCEHLSDTKSKKKGKKKKSRKMRHRKGKGRHGQAAFQAVAKTSSAAHQRITGSFTFEVWARSQLDMTQNYNGQAIFQFGDSNQCITAGINADGLSLGARGNRGNLHMFVQPTLDLSDWTHLAFTFDADEQTWTIYVNGREVEQSPSNFPLDHPTPCWFFGAGPDFGESFRGQLADIRIWTAARTAEQIAADMASPIANVEAAETEGLVAYYPCDDGIGLTLRDLTSHKHPAQLTYCAWAETGRPVESLAAEAGATAEPILLHHEAVQDSLVYTNGECLAILYRYDVAGKAFPGFTDMRQRDAAVLQIFSLSSGELISESEISCEHLTSACVSPSSTSMWAAMGTEAGVYDRYRCAPPSATSRWRLERLDTGNESGFPTTIELLKRFPLPGSADLDQAGQSANAATTATGAAAAAQQPIDEDLLAETPAPDLESDAGDDDEDDESGSDSDSSDSAPDHHAVLALEDDPNAVPIHIAVVHILARLSQDCEARFQPQSSGSPPASLCLPLAVELSKHTFRELLNLTELLSKDYYAADLAKYGDLAEVRLFGFLVCLRLLRVNMLHLAAWNVDPVACGFGDDAKQQKKPKGKKKRKKDRTMQGRYVRLLNKLITKPPTSKLSALVATRVTSEVCESLSVGMPVFYASPHDRVAILSNLIKTATAASEDPQLAASDAVVMQLQLMDRYFEELSLPHNVVTLVPALVSLYASSKASGPHFLEQILQLTLRSTEAQARQTLEQEHDEDEDDDDEAKAPDNDDGDDAPVNLPAAPASRDKQARRVALLRDFLSRVQLCLLTSATRDMARARAEDVERRNAPGANTPATPTDDKKKDAQAAGKEAASAHRKRKMRERAQNAFDFSVHYAMHAIVSCTRLVRYVEKRFEALEAEPESMSRQLRLDAARVFVSTQLKDSVGALLLPLLSSLVAMELPAHTVSTMLPVLFRLMRSLHALCTRLPDVVAKENDFVEGKLQRVVVSRTVSVQSAHPVSQGVTERTLTIPGAKEMVLQIDPKTFQQQGQGSSLTLYRRPGQQDPIENGSFSTPHSQPIHIQGDSVTIVYNIGYLQSAWGFAVTGRALVEEARVELPWLLDLTKTVTLMASRCAARLVRGDFAADVDELDSSGKPVEAKAQAPGQLLHDPSESSNRKYLENDFFQFGLEFDEQVDAAERALLSWLPEDLAADPDDPVELPAGTPAHGAMPFLQRQVSYDGVELPALGLELAAKLRASPHARVAGFPVPEEVQPLVDRAIAAAVAVLVKHNMLTRESQRYIEAAEADPSAEPNDGLVRVWRSAHRLRRWLLQRYQKMRSQESEESAKNDEQADKADDAEASGDKADKPDDEEPKPEPKLRSRLEIYQELCDLVVDRCRFLLEVVPVPNAWSDTLAAGAPQLAHQATSSGGKPIEMTDEQKVLLAWQSTKESVELKYASPEERYGLVWRHVLQFFDNTSIDVQSLHRSITVRRLRARVKSCGLRAFRQLLDAVSMCNMRRDIIGELVPALCLNDKEAFSGLAPDVMEGLAACGPQLTGDLQRSMHAVYGILTDILSNPKQSGPHLLQAALHAFSLDYDREEFNLVVSLGIFPALHKLLLEDEEDQFAGDDDALLEEEEYDEEQQEEDEEDEAEVERELRKGFKTSAWALLNMLTTTILSNQGLNPNALDDSDAASSSRKSKIEPIYVILEAQLARIAQQLEDKHVRSLDEEYVPSLSGPALLGGSLGDATEAGAGVDANSRAVAMKVATVSSFGMETSQTGLGEGGQLQDGSAQGNADQALFGDAFHVKVLNLVESICHLTEGRARIVRKAPGSDASPLSSLLRILHTGSPRARLVVLRILRSLLTSPESPALEELDADLVACLQQLARDTATVQPQADNFVRHFLSLIGRANTAPVFAALSLDSVSQSPEVREVLRSINATNLHSADGIHLPSEAVMFVRFLARSRRSEWAQAVQDVVVPLLDSLPTLTEKLNTMQRGLAALEAEAARVAAASGASAPSADPTARQRSELTRQLAVDSEFWASFWPALGALCVCGGFVSTLEVGARVRYTPDGTTGTIVSRSPERGMLQYIRDGEGSVNEVDAKDVVCCGDVPLDVPVLLGDTSRVTGLLTSLTSLLGVLDIRKGAAALRGQADVPASSAAATSSGKSAAPAKRDPTALELLAAELHARAARALFALLQQDVSYVQAFVDDPEKLRVVQALATEASPSVRGTTAAIEDLVSALGHEASKRAKIQSTIEVTLKLGRGSGSTLEIARPEADFKLEQTWVGGKLGDQHTSGGPKLSTVFEPADGAGSDDEDEAKAAEDGDGDGDAAAPPSDGFGFGSGSADGPPTGGFGFAGGAGGPGGFDSASGAGDPKSGGFGFAGGAGGPASGGFGSAGAAGGPKSGGFGFPGGKGLGKGGKGGKGLGKGDKAGKGGKGGKGVASAQSPEEEFPGAPAELLKKLKAVDGAGGDAAAAKQLRKQLSGYASKSSQQAAGDNDADGADEFSFGGNDAGGQEKLAFGAGGAGSAGAQPMSFGASGAFGNPGSGDAPPTPMTAPVASGNFLDTASAAGASGWRNPSPSNPAFGNPPAGMHAPAMAMGGMSTMATPAMAMGGMSTMATPAMAMGGAPTGWGGMSGGQHLMQQQMQQQMQQMQPQQHMQPQQQMQPAPAPAPKAKVAPKATKVRLSGPAVGKTSVRGELSYLRLNKAPSEEVCRGKVVVLDSYGFFEQRAAKCVELGAEAVVLALHSANGRFEGLDEVTEADLAGANAGAKTEEVEEQGILEQARARAIRTAIASAGGGPMAAPEEDIEDDVDLPGKEEAGPSDSVEEWRRAFDAAQRAAADGKIGVVDPAAAKLAESIAASFMPAEQVSALLNRVPVYCCNDSTALVLRRLCGARESDDPARLNCDILDEQLVQMGFPAKHTRRALEKNSWKIGKAAEWLAENAEWLAEQEEMMDMLNLGKGGKTTAPQVAKKSSRKSKARPAKSDSFELLDVGDASADDVEPASDAQSASGKAEPKAGGLDWSLESTWAEFGQSNSFSISGSEAQPSSTLSASVAAGLPLASTYAILEHAMRAQASVVVHYARRALVSLFARWPRDKSLAQFGSPKALVQTLHVALEQEPHHAVLGEDAEDAEAILSRDFRRTLLRALLDDKARDSSLLADTILADCEKQLKQATEDPSLDEDEAEEVAGSAAPRPRPKARLSVRRPAGRVPLPDSSSSEESECEEEIRIMGEPATSSATAPAAAAALGEASEMRSLPKPIVVPVNGRPHEWFPIEKLSVRGAKWLNIKVKLKIDMSRVFGGEIMVSFYSSSDGDPNSVVSQVMLYEQPNMISSEEVLVNAGTVWYSVTSNNWYEGHHAATKAELEVSYMCPPGADQGDVIHGSLSSTLVFMDVLMCSLQPGLVELLLLLLRALPSIEERQLAQQCCRTAARLFNHWDKLVEVEDPAVVQACAPEIAQIVELLEQTHTSLRSSTLLDWARATIPGPHLQTLLELVLAARAAFPRQPKTDAGGDDPLADVDPRVVEAFAKHRDGPVHVSLIHLQRRQLSKEMHLVVGPNCYNGVTYIGDVCVKRGRWYWELKLETRPSYVAVGWVTRDFTPANAINNDSMGFTWSAVGPNNAFMHRGMDVVGGSNHHGGLFGGGGPARSSNHAALKVARWEPDTVIGVLVDIDAKEMSFTFNGNNTTTVFSGFDVGDGLYPALSCGQSTSVRVNFGAEPFAHPPPPELSCATPASGDPSSAGHGDDGAEAPMPWAPLQHSDIVESSWLDRYRHASQVTQLVYERKDLPPDVVDASLSQEVSLTADSDADFHFECVSIDGSDTAKRRGAAAGGALGNWNVPGGAGGGGLFSNQNNWGASPFGGLGSSGNAMRDVDRVLQDDRSVFTHGGASPSHLTFKVSGPDDTPFYLRELVVRVPFSNNNSYGHSGWGGKAVRKMASGSGASVSGMVFLSEKKPEVDSFEWCNEFRREHFEQFIQRKQSMGQEFRAHEPLAFFQFKQGETTQTVQIELPPRAVYVTVKFIYSDALQLEYLGFRCIHGEHPLGHLIGTPLAEAKSQDLLAELKEGVHASLSADWDVAKDEELVTMLQTISQRLGVSPMSLSAVMLRPDDGDLTRFKELEHAPLNAMRARFGLIKYLNRLVTPLLHYVDVSLYESEMKMGEELRLASLRRRRLLRAQEDEDGVLVEEEEDDEAKADDDDDDDQADDAVLAAAQTEADREAEVDDLLMANERSLSFVVHKLKGLYFMSTKKSVFDMLLAEGAPRNPTVPRISVNRIKAARSRDNRAGDPDGLNSTFGQIFTQLRGVPYSQLRGQKDQQMWNVAFLGEGSVDVGGPYRESVTNMCADLMSDSTPLFVHAPNGVNDVGLNRDKWVINPTARSSVHLAMFEFIGALMGMALRTKLPLSLDLPSLFWKKLLDESVDISDLEGVDKLCVQALGEISSLEKAKFDYLVDEHFTTQLSDHSVVELKENGQDLPVTFEARKEFVELVIQARLRESDKQLHAVRKGLDAVVPVRMLSLFSWYDLEVMVCGNPVIDIEDLRRHTNYNGYSSTHSVIKNLFKALHSFNNEERQMFLRFVWGRNRLPSSASDWSTNFTVNRLNSSKPDEVLVLGHCCFFSLDLPTYSTYEILRSKLLYAITNCVAVDVDFNPTASSLAAWIDVD